MPCIVMGLSLPTLTAATKYCCVEMLCDCSFLTPVFKFGR